MFRLKKSQIKQDSAQVLAVQALEFLAADEDRLNNFLTSTGMDVGDLREIAASDHFAESLLDFICSSDELVLAFCESAGTSPEQLMRTVQGLKGYDSL